MFSREAKYFRGLVRYDPHRNTAIIKDGTTSSPPTRESQKAPNM